MGILYAVIVLGGLGIFFGGLLSYVAQRFAVEEDPRVEIIADLLPGANCGACGLPGCINFAEKVVRGEAPPNSCIAGGKAVCDNICKVLGIKLEAIEEKKIAAVFCLGTKDLAADKFEYRGVQDCKAALMFGRGFKACNYGCLGLGTCVHVCPFDAIHMGDNGLPVVDPERCTGCGLCAKACVRGIIQMVSAERKVKAVLCNSKDRGKATRQICTIGCIGCKACVKACPQEAIVVENNLAVIDEMKCDNCGKCVEVCPRGTIKDAIAAGRVAVPI